MNDITLILRAASFAAHKHRNQRRKDADASPYINQLLGLARVLADEGGGEVVYSGSNPGEWYPVSPESIDEALWKVACGVQWAQE